MILEKYNTIDDVPPEFRDRIYPAQCEMAARIGFAFEDLRALAEKGGEEAESAEKAITVAAVRHVIRQVMDEAEELRLDHINDEAWCEHRNDTAQRLSYEFRQEFFETETKKMHEFEDRCESLQDYRNLPDDVMSIPFDESDPAYHFNEIGFLARKTGHWELLEQARALYSAFDETQTLEEEVDRLEKAFITFAQKAKVIMNGRLFLRQKSMRHARDIVGATVLLYVSHARPRAYRSPPRPQRTGADSGSGDDDPEPESEPPEKTPRHLHFVTSPRSDAYTPPRFGLVTAVVALKVWVA
jgi:DNA-binding transcriptional regulator/RsmH inhibitor MraZ